VVSSSKSNLVIAGSTGDPRDVVLTFDNANGTPRSATTCPAVVAATCGTAGSATVTLSGAGVQVRDLTISNTFDKAAHPEIGTYNTQAVALRATGDRQVYRDVRLRGVQDTLNADASGNITADGSGYPRQYYVDSFIEGNVDFVFGRATAVFDRTTIHATAHGGGTIFAPSTASKARGYLVVDSRIASDADETFALGRPWRSWSDGAYGDVSRGQTALVDTWISDGVSTTQPWVDFAPNVWTDGRFAEHGTTRGRSSATPTPPPRRRRPGSPAPTAGTRRSRRSPTSRPRPPSASPPRAAAARPSSPGTSRPRPTSSATGSSATGSRSARPRRRATRPRA
jgi:pectin methylesterase-like acyl-CoA thioesterase